LNFLKESCKKNIKNSYKNASRLYLQFNSEDKYEKSLLCRLYSEDLNFKNTIFDFIYSYNEKIFETFENVIFRFEIISGLVKIFMLKSDII
jgi:hypothetical protein